MPICRPCGQLIKPLGMPVSIVEKMEVELRQIIKDVNYQLADDYYKYPARHPVPAMPCIAEFCEDVVFSDDGFVGVGVSIVVWKAPCEIVKIWSSEVQQ